LFFGIQFAISFWIIGLIVLYFIIKTAAKHVLKEYYERRNEGREGPNQVVEKTKNSQTI